MDVVSVHGGQVERKMLTLMIDDLNFDFHGAPKQLRPSRKFVSNYEGL